MYFSDKLLQYIEDNGINRSILAQKFGVSTTMIHKYIEKNAQPKYQLARKIEVITNHYISMREMGYAD